MSFVFNIFYGVLLVTYLFFTGFIVFHLWHYTLNRSVALFTLVFFLIGTAILVSTNASLFLSIPSASLQLPGAPTSSF